MPGNQTNYDNIDVIRCFLSLETEKSRLILKKDLDLGEGSIRGILNDLKQKGLILSTKKGHLHSKKGEVIFENIIKKFHYPYSSASKKFLKDFFPLYEKDNIRISHLFNLTLDENIKKRIYMYRDLAIKAGADGCLILKLQGKKISLMDYCYEENMDEINEMIKVKRDSIILICIGKTIFEADRGMINLLLHMTDVFRKLKV
jgi:hypothetical protein